MSRVESLERLASELNQLSEYLHNVFNLNHGGCCLFAYLVAKELDNRDIEYSLVIEDDGWLNVDNIVKEIETRKCNKESCNSISKYNTKSHYFLNLTELDIDINSYNSYNNRIDIPITNYTPIKWIYEHGYWNQDFLMTINEDIDLIKHNIKLIFNKYDTEN